MASIANDVTGGGQNGKDEVTNASTIVPDQTDIDTDRKASERANRTEMLAVAQTSTKASKPEKGTAAKKKVFENHHPGQCGLENDGSKWFPYKAPKRLTTTLATPEEQANYQSIIDAILHDDTICGKRVEFHPNIVQEVMIKVQSYIGREPVLIEDVPLGCTVVGDIHGQLFDLYRVFGIHAKDGKPGYLGSKYLFLGNYVDRGPQSLEVIMLLCCLKIRYPDNFFLLRGTHEFAVQNCKYGFGKELAERYNKQTFPQLFAQCNETFCYLSLAAIVGGMYLCVHGGISPTQFNRRELRGLKKPIINSTEDVLIQDMMWSDPAVGLRGTVFNYERGCSIFYGLDALVCALHNMGCIALLRGHSTIRKGYDNQWDVCFTITTATGKNNDGAACYINEKAKFMFYVHERDLIRVKVNEELYGNDVKEGGNDTGNISIIKAL